MWQLLNILSFLALLNEGVDCYPNCGGQQGKCSWCGSEGFCCREGWHDTSNGCDGTFGGQRQHECVLKSGMMFTSVSIQRVNSIKLFCFVLSKYT